MEVTVRECSDIVRERFVDYGIETDAIPLGPPCRISVLYNYDDQKYWIDLGTTANEQIVRLCRM